ncbi:hypothetical protein A5790_02630 [Mycobacterium sp. 852002-51152_SCH6134967]|uniref:DUF899 domain-containing protein n=1 Tax=Mycobacterium sp. 852002-51152_SCH6134967 TaxID=1834096 RepID=UPI0007FD9DF7|nr:DUF899 domain-containing protein [Mycobacterium sp. 852002-51152_SCH6134967]OBF98649.1 hypothetical protein A5790_02630 [Mycobacterium sp. 852002-51152_SCH6134967]
MKPPPIVAAQEWEAAWQEMLVKEKELMRARDALAAQRRRMPWMAVDNTYTFEGPQGRVSLLDLFDGRRQLLVYRAFIEPGTGDGDVPGLPGWPDHGCVGCSLMADHVPNLAHLNARDTALVYVSRATQPELQRMKAKMGWDHIPWYTILPGKDAAFDEDFGVKDWHGTNVFIRDDENRVYRTYLVNGRGDEVFVNTWNLLDVTPLGRQEDWEDSPEGYPQGPPYEWWRWHDTYDQRTP